VALPTLSENRPPEQPDVHDGVEGFAYGVNGLLDLSFTRTGGTSYISDVNGGRICRTYPRTASTSTAWWPVSRRSPPPVRPRSRPSASDASGMVQIPERAIDMEGTFHLIDPLRRWSAPYSGSVAITGQVRLKGRSPAGLRDGGRRADQHPARRHRNLDHHDRRSHGPGAQDDQRSRSVAVSAGTTCISVSIPSMTAPTTPSCSSRRSPTTRSAPRAWTRTACRSSSTTPPRTTATAAGPPLGDAVRRDPRTCREI